MHGLTVLFCVANLYAAAGYVFREALSQRRFAVANSPNVDFFRALDLPARDVLIVYCGLRTTAYYLALLVINVVFTVVFSALPVLLLMPVSMYVVTLAVAARSALRRTRPQPIRAPVWAGLGLLCFGLGYATVTSPTRSGVSGLCSTRGPSTRAGPQRLPEPAGSAVFAVPSGCGEGGLIGRTFLEQY